jgi:coenzyme F420-0:L-glutamate ligase/coenzyme F420-1:gamma-L-glutamate ligase
MAAQESSPLVLTPVTGLPLVREGDDLGSMILEALQLHNLELIQGDILVVAQKVVSKAEGRKVRLDTVTPSRPALELAEQTGKDPRVVELILQESSQVIRTRPGLVIVEHKLGFICANAGIDHSNVDPEELTREDWVLLLPEDPDASADRLRKQLEAHSGTSLGVLIIDSHGRAWRLGTVGTTIGLSRVPGVVDLRGTPDLFQQRLRITEVGAADELAAGASLLMGQAGEGIPIVHVRGFPHPLRGSGLQEILRPEEQDLFR